MKILFTIIVILLLTSCSDFDKKYSCTKGTITVLNKRKSAYPRDGAWLRFDMYLYNGTFAEWYSADEKTYNTYNINDTLPTIILTIINTKKD